MFARIVFLYHIKVNDDNYYYTNSNRNLIFNENEYIAIPIKHASIESDSDEVTKSKIDVNMTNQCDFINAMMSQYDAFITELTIYRYYTSTGDVETEFKGTMSTIEFSVKDAKVSFANVLYDTQRMAMRMVFQRQCPFALYGSQCRVNKLDYAQQTDVADWTKVDDYHLHYSGSVELSSRLTGGILQFPNGAYFFIRYFNTEENTITVSRPIYTAYFPNSGSITLYEGCDRTIETCEKHFHNSENYGGFVMLPLDTPVNRNHLANAVKKDIEAFRDYVEGQLR